MAIRSCSAARSAGDRALDLQERRLRSGQGLCAGRDHLLSSPQLLVVNPAVPVNSMQELVAYAKANPGKISFASPGFGTQPHLLGEMLRLAAGADIMHVPYRGPRRRSPTCWPARCRCTSRRPPCCFRMSRPASSSRLRSPTSPQPQLPRADHDRKRLPEAPGHLLDRVLAPAGTPTDIVNKLNAAINDITNQRRWRRPSQAQRQAEARLAADFAAFMAAETKKWAEVINAAGIKAE